MPETDAPLCGFLNVLKPPGMTSAQVVGFARLLLGGEKVGHAGTLDPEAAGVLPLMVGKAARLFDLMQDKEKAYVTEVAFGAATDTQDAQGVAVEVGESYPDEAAIRAALKGFVGTISQTPPMYSALKQNGKRLYELARDGKRAEVPAREVTVHELELRSVMPNHGALLYVRCSKGFYVRTLCQDLGKALGCPAHMRFLLRTQSGAFTLDTACTLERLSDAAARGALRELVLPPEAALAHVVTLDTPAGLENALRNGGRLPWRRFAAARGTAAETGVDFALRLDGRLCAIAHREGDEVKRTSWLGD